MANREDVRIARAGPAAIIEALGTTNGRVLDLRWANLACRFGLAPLELLAGGRDLRDLARSAGVVEGTKRLPFPWIDARGSDLRDAVFVKVAFEYVGGNPPDDRGASLDLADLRDAVFSDCRFDSESYLRGTRFENASFSETVFYFTNFRTCNFDGAWMDDSVWGELDFVGCSMRGLNANGMRCFDTRFSGCDLRALDLEIFVEPGCTLVFNGCDLRGSRKVHIPPNSGPIQFIDCIGVPDVIRMGEPKKPLPISEE